MRQGVCVKCGATTVRAAKDGIDMGDHQPPGTFLRPNIGPGFKGMARLEKADLWAFACTTCGYVELYLLDPTGIAFITEKWAEVTPPAPAPPPPPPPAA